MAVRILDGARLVLGTVAAVVLVANAVTVTLPAEADPWVNAPQSLVIVAPPRLPDATDMIKRDPFAGGPSGRTRSSPSPAPFAYPGQGRPVAMSLPPAPNFNVPNAGQPAIPGFPGSGGSEVPNPGSILPPNGQASERVRIVGTVIGDGRPPVAMISDGQHVDFAHIGDTISGKKIVDIRVQGIVFEDGTRVAVSDADTHAAPGATTDSPPVPKSGSQKDGNGGNPVPASPETSPPVPSVSSSSPINPAGGGPVQTSPYTQIEDGAPPTITPGNYGGAPPTLAPGATEAPLPRYVSPNQQVAP